MKRFLIVAALAALTAIPRAGADEGMWLPSLIGNRINDMQQKGLRLSAEELYSINQASMKDAIVKFGRGCTGELVSAEGLLLTNHHCGYPQIQSHSSLQNDYLTRGFWAMNREEELPNPGLSVTFLVRMDDVTGQVLEGTEGLDEAAANARRHQNIDRIVDQATAGTHYEAVVESFYYGNLYYLFVNEVFRDVRLVAAPPSSIGNFGGDSDNWMWPRHTGDFSVFRIYADADNNPAEYSPNNVPYSSKKYFTVSTRGVDQGDFTFVYGFPGSTRQYLHSEAVRYVLERSNPLKIDLRTQRLNVIRAAQQTDPAIRIAYAEKAAGIANAWKKWQGESLGLARLGTISKKQEFEQRYSDWAAPRPEYAGVPERIGEIYRQVERYNYALDLTMESIWTMEILGAARTARTLEAGGLDSRLDEFYNDYYPWIDRKISGMMLQQYLELSEPEFVPDYLLAQIANHGGPQEYLDWLFDNTVLADRSKLEFAIADENRWTQTKNEDPAFVLLSELSAVIRDEINGPVKQNNSELDLLYRNYVRGMMEYEPERVFFPDANMTLRIAYGSVSGYRPEDGVIHYHQSTERGILEKDDPEVYEYNIPQDLRAAFRGGDFGRWGLGSHLPVNFLATNHTTGGNSGSPVLNGDGHLVGINFDRTWLSTMSDIEFDPEMCRNISVDIRYVLYIIDRVGNAGYLIEEMTLM